MSGTGIEVSPDLDPGETLAHYGKKGMRWGVTTTDSGSGGAAPTRKSKPTSDEIVAARQNVTKQSISLQQAKTWAKKNTTGNTPERMLADQKVAKLEKDFLTNPDRVTAATMTRGEKIVTGILLGSGFGTSIGVGVVAGNAAGKAIIKSQARKASSN